MGKNKRRVLEVFDAKHGKNLEVDSQEEVEFVKWLNEATSLGVVKDFEYQPKPFKLSGPAHYNDGKKVRSLFREHVYTADFILYVDSVKNPSLARELKLSDSIKDNGDIKAYYIDIKGGFMSNGSARSFPINQKWVYEKFHVYVHKLIPKEFFKEFGIPEELKFTEKTKKPSKKYAGYPLIKDIAKGN